MQNYTKLKRLWNDQIHSAVSAAGLLALVCGTIGAMLVLPAATSAGAAGLPSAYRLAVHADALAPAFQVVPGSTSLGLTPAATSSLSTSSVTYYVSPSGSDAGNCSSLTPCASLLYATHLTHPGDTVVVLSGTYGPQIITANGTSAAPIRIQARDSVVLTRPSPASSLQQTTPLLQINNSSYLAIQKFTVLGMKGRSDYTTSATPYGGEVVIQDHSTATGMYIMLDHFTVEHANQTCIKAQDAEPYAVVQYSVILDCGQPNNGLDHDIYMTGLHDKVLNNSVSGSSGYGIHFWGPSTTYADIEGNTVSNAAEAGIIVQGSRAFISGNTVQNNAWGISAYGWDTFTHNVFRANTVNNGGTNGYAILFNTMTHETIEYNTFYQDKVEVQSNSGSDGTNLIESNIFVGLNKYSQTDPAFATGDTAAFNDYYEIQLPAQLGLSSAGPNSIMTNPQFASAPDNLHLLLGSPCQGSGLSGQNIGAF